MSFLSLSALWFALTIPVVIAFYLLKRRRKIHLVSSNVLWQRFLIESQANAPFQRLRKSVLLLLQLLILVLAILALMRPYFSEERSGGALQVLVLDVSASMQSIDVSPSRFEEARQQAIDLVDGMRDSDEMVIVAAGARTAVVQSPTSEKGLLRRAIGALKVSDGPTRLLEALELAGTLVRDHPLSEIHLLTDGAVSDLGKWDETDLDLRFYPVGVRGDNVGIVSMDVRPSPEDPVTQGIFSSVVNFSTNQFSFVAELHLDQRMVASRPVQLAGGESVSLTFIERQITNGVFSLTLDLEDDLGVDNVVDVVSLLPRPAKALLLSEGNRFLEKSIELAGDVSVSVSPDPATDPSGFDITVLDGVTPLRWPEGNVLAINLVPTNWFRRWERTERPAVVDWKGAHPLLRFVTFDEVEIAEAYAVSPPFWGEGLVESARFPLIVAGEQGSQRRLWIGFDTLQSTWPLRVSFPIFMANAVRWLNPALSRAREVNVATGQPIQMGWGDSDSTVTIQRPHGETESVVLNRELKGLIYANTLERGLYRVGEGPDASMFAANLLDAAESDTGPRSALRVSNGRRVKATLERPVDMEIWRWIALAALGGMMLEWWYFHRRTV